MSAAASPAWVERAAENWKAGVQAAADRTARNREAAKAVAVANRARGAQTRCGIKGCTRHAYKGRVCRNHYELVPWELRMGAYMAGVQGQLKATARHHRRYLPAVRAILAQQAK